MAARIPTAQAFVTQETVSNAHLLLRLTTIESVDANVIKDAIQELGTIFERYNEWRDRLSLNLHVEGGKIFEDITVICTAGQTIPIHVIQDFANRHFSKLNILLVNDLDRAPLKDPMLDGEWVWEKEVLDTAKALSPISPFTGQPFAEIPHQFAKSLIEFIKSFTFVPLPPPPALQIVPAAPNGALALHQNGSFAAHLDVSLMQMPQDLPPQLIMMMRNYQTAFFQQQALLRINERTSLELAERGRQVEQRAEQLIPMIRERIREGVEQAQRHAAAFEQSINNKVESYNQIRQQENQVVQSRLDVTEQRVQILDNKCDRLEQKVVVQEKCIAQKEAEVASLRGQLASALNRVNDSGGDGGCTLL